MSRCPECGLCYVPEVLENAKYHKVYHDKKVNGIRYRRAKSEKVIWEEGHLRITVANFFSPNFLLGVITQGRTLTSEIYIISFFTA